MLKGLEATKKHDPKEHQQTPKGSVYVIWGEGINQGVRYRNLGDINCPGGSSRRYLVAKE